MRSLLAAAVMIGLLSTHSWSQGLSGSPGMSSQNGTSGSQGRGKGRRGAAQKTQEQTPKVDEKAYRSALDSLPDKKFDPWRDVR